MGLPAAAGARTAEDLGVWTNLTAIGTVGPRVAYFVEVQPRTADGVGRLGQLLLRSGLGWKFSDAVTVYGGYLRLVTPVRGGRDGQEDRPFAQLSWNLGRLAGGGLSSRTRLELRRPHAGRDTGWRLREMIRYVHPLGSPDRPRALASTELFAAFNDTDWGARAGFDQARTFLGLELPIRGGRSTVEAGYLNQTINDPGGRVRVNHVASVSLWLRP